ncbi:MAG: DUF2752 domain-containing protein [Phycisphaerae bacterium]
MSLDAPFSPLDAPVSPGRASGPVPTAGRVPHPLGPRIVTVALEGLTGRVYAAGVAAAAVAVLVVAARLTPDASGIGTHRQLGLPPCGFAVMSGLPCPTCGMTTAFSLAVRGRWFAAMRAQPAGFALALATATTAVLALLATATGRRVTLNWYRINPTRLIWLATLAFLVAWGLKIVQVLSSRRG